MYGLVSLLLPRVGVFPREKACRALCRRFYCAIAPGYGVALAVLALVSEAGAMWCQFQCLEMSVRWWVAGSYLVRLGLLKLGRYAMLSGVGIRRLLYLLGVQTGSHLGSAVRELPLPGALPRVVRPLLLRIPSAQIRSQAER